jgi:hypothetical protein
MALDGSSDGILRMRHRERGAVADKVVAPSPAAGAIIRGRSRATAAAKPRYSERTAALSVSRARYPNFIPARVDRGRSKRIGHWRL